MTKSWKWLKRILWVLLGLFVLLFLAVSVFVYIINSESYLEDYLKENLGVEATIGELDVSLLSGTIKVSSSIIGPKDDPFIQFEQLEGELDYSHLWSSQLTVELLQLNNAKVRYPFEFKLKESEQSAEETSLPFDFIDVAAIDVNNLDFEYRGEVSLLAEGAEVKVRNIPVAEDGFLLFEDLQRLVKASNTTLEARLKSLKSDKTQLNDLSLSAHIDGQRLVIDDIHSGQSSININLLDHSQASAATTETAQTATTTNPQANDLELPFDDIVIKKIDLGKTDLAIQDKQELSIKAIEAEFSELLLVQKKKALWLDWPSFYIAQNSRFNLSSEAMASDMVDFESLKMSGELKQGQFVIPQFELAKPIFKLNVGSDSSGGGEVAEGAEQWFLPFKTVKLLNGSIEQGTVRYAQSDAEHQLSDITLELKNTPLVVDNKPVFAVDTLNVGSEQASVSLKSSAYSGSYGDVGSLTSEVLLADSSVEIKSVGIDKANVRYQLDTKASKSTDKSSQSESEVAAVKSMLPLETIALSELTINDGAIELQQDEQNYSAQGVTLKLSNVPIYAGGDWVALKPQNWQQKSLLNLETASFKMPQGDISGLTVNSEYQDNRVTVNELGLGSADLSIDAAADDKNQNTPSSESLPIDYVELNNIDLRQISLRYRNDDVQYQMSGGNLTLDSFPLVRSGQLVSDPVPHFSNAANSINLNIGKLSVPEGSVDGLQLRGTLRNKDLMLDYLRTSSADLTLTQAGEAQTEQEDDKDAKEKQQSEPEKFALRTLKIGDLKLSGVNAQIKQGPGEEQEDEAEVISVENLYLGATELVLAKNHQTIDQWYGSQLENAFTLVALKVGKIAQKQTDINDLTVTAIQNNQTITIQPLRMTINEAPLSAKWVIDLTQQPYRSTYISEFNNLLLEKLVEPETEDGIAMSGSLQGDIDVEFYGLEAETIADTLQGKILVRNQTPVTLHRLNVNKVLRSFLDSQKFGLLDVGGFLLAGPLGLLASQGVSIQDTLSQLGADQGDTHFSHLNVDMDIAKGVMTTKDVAAATLKYRFAFNGQINLAEQQFNDFEFDIINEKGCSEYGQTLNGSLASPEIETFTAAFDAVTGSITGLFKQGVGLITGGACSAIYEGVVPHPEDGAEIIPKEQQRTIDPNAEPSATEGGTAEEDAVDEPSVNETAGEGDN
ncbi:AsmA family protein [Kangiella taiwanensis]|uniref:AsmA domain-containing protein n=1 Tax=Kangiella taiwanensis TaxID=1079179 RepID=A0ABP8I547_9GAMM|nr:AsmA family protein [Kangiella taiwanensis]